jgi:transcriptional regulator with XRE-family HTH domain
MAARDVKLGETLGTLIEQGGFRRNRGRICEAVEVSPAALSQYLGSRTRPSFEVLVRLADFFGVSLDYLVYGDQVRSTPAPDYGPLVRYVDVSLSRVQDKAQQHAAIVSKVGRILSEQVDDAVREALASSTISSAGLLSADDTWILESYAEESLLITLNLDYDVIALPGGEDEAAGKFLPVVAQNIADRRRYRFLLPHQLDVDWKDLVTRMRRLLMDHCSADLVNRYCQFRSTDASIFTGTVIYKIDIDAIRTRLPAFFQVVSEFIDDDGWLSYSISSSEQLNSAVLHDTKHRENARRQFELLWKKSSAL